MRVSTGLYFYLSHKSRSHIDAFIRFMSLSQKICRIDVGDMRRGGRLRAYDKGWAVGQLLGDPLGDREPTAAEHDGHAQPKRSPENLHLYFGDHRSASDLLASYSPSVRRASGGLAR